MAEGYNELVLEHYRNPRNVGEIENADGVGVFLSDFCGDITKFWVKVERGRIVDVKFKTQGCAAALACGSALSLLVEGKTVEDAQRICKEDVVKLLGGLPERKIHCSLLAVDAFQDALYDYFRRNNLPAPREYAEKHERVKPVIEDLKSRGYLWI